MSFSRFVWLLQKKQLWLSRANLLGDPWEIALVGNQLEHVISRHAIAPSGALMPLVNTLSGPQKARQETPVEHAEREIRRWRRETFVSCWSASEHESHALWRIYCRSNEGVAIPTTLCKLAESVGELPICRVTYEEPGRKKIDPTLLELVAKKRPMFAYEQEVRIVSSSAERGETKLEGDAEGASNSLMIINLPPSGRIIDWNPEQHVESVWVHPDADESFMQVVSGVVEHYAPRLKDRVAWSAMAMQPPF